MYRVLLGTVSIFVALSAATAGTVKPHDGWMVIDTRQSFPSLAENLDSAVKSEKMGIVTAASASEGAKTAGIAIPGNRIIGVFRNDFARRMLKASVSAGIEAPIRFYITENPDGTTTLSYKKPSYVFAPYLEGDNGDLKLLASELDDIFARIASSATKEK